MNQYTLTNTNITKNKGNCWRRMFRRRLLSRHKKYYRIGRRISTWYDDLVQNVRRVFVCINGFPFHIVRTLLPMSVNALVHKLVDSMVPLLYGWLDINICIRIWTWTVRTPFTVSNIQFINRSTASLQLYAYRGQ